MLVRTVYALLILSTLCDAQAPQTAKPANTTPPKVEVDLGTILQQTAEKVLSSCQSWPPRLAKSDSDRNTRDLRRLQDATDILTTELSTNLLVDPKMKPHEYQASFLRLLDTVGALDPDIPDVDLLRLVSNTDPNELSLWGKDLAAVKHDCMSMLGLVAKGKGNYAIPFFSIDAAFNSNFSTASNLTSTFLYGTFQSPFDNLYKSDNQGKRLLASLRALNWRLKAPTGAPDEYISVAHILSIDKDYATLESSSLLGKIKAGVQVTVADVSSGLSGQIATSLQTNSKSYRTYFWGAKTTHLPDIPALSKSASGGLPQFTLDSPVLTTSNVIHASAPVVGWPEDMCNGAQWKIQTNNVNLKTMGLAMIPSTPSSGLPSCSISATFSLATASLPPSASDIADPKLQIVNVSNAALVIPVQTCCALSIPDKPQVNVAQVPAKWNVTVDPSGAKSDVQWIIAGHVDVPNGRKLSQIAIAPSDFNCKPSDNSGAYPISSVQIEGAPGSLIRTGSDTSFKIDAQLSLLSLPAYNDDFAQPNKRTCAIYGSLKISTSDLAGGGTQTDSFDFHTSTVFYPNELPSSAPTPPTGAAAVASTGQIVLSWNPVPGAGNYSVYRANSSGSEVLFKSGISTTSFTDSGLASGTKYFYVITATNVTGESGKSLETTATAQ